jgi:glycosyltransferase involved in cell wall biosynthesis
LKTARSLAFNARENTRQLLLDVSTIIKNDAKSGIQRVVKSIIWELLSRPIPGLEVKLVYFENGQYLHANSFTKKILSQPEDTAKDEPQQFNQDDIYLSLDLNMHLTQETHPLHFKLKCVGVNMFYIVYDILLVRHPEWWKPELKNMFENWLKSITTTATSLICISESVAGDVTNWISENCLSKTYTPKVDSFHLGADFKNRSHAPNLAESDNTIINLLHNKISFLMVGTIEPRKGYLQTLGAFELLWKRQVDVVLLIVGKEGWLVEELVEKIRSHPELNRRLFWLEGISDDYLDAIYRSSTCLIAASEAEGFGLPLIEAAQYKLPIIARDIQVFKEVAGNHAFYFQGTSTTDLAKDLQRWLALNVNCEIPKSTDMPWLTWKQSADQLTNVILSNS